jgi:hypothetical protein
MPEEKDLVEQEVVEAPVEESTHEPMEQEVQEQPRKDHPNFASLREKAEQLERENAAYRDRVARLEQYASQYSQQENYGEENITRRPKQNDEYIAAYQEIAPDDLVEGKHLTALQKEIIALRKAEQKREEEYRHQQYQAQVKNQYEAVRSKYNDYDAVVNEQNLNKLWADHPTLARSLSLALQNGDVTGVAHEAYDILKRYGYHKASDYSYAQEKARINEDKPQRSQSSPLAQAKSWDGVLTEDLKMKHAEDLERAINS